MIKKLNPDIVKFYIRIFFMEGRKLYRLRQYMRIFLMQIRGALKRFRKDVPPVLILSSTKKCNLNCKGCYAKHTVSNKADMDDAALDKLLDEAEELGISACITAGGEPFYRKSLIDIMSRHRNVLFAVFTNGTLLNKDMADKIKKAQNIVPVISMEGIEGNTDLRRGAGIYGRIKDSIEILNKGKVFFAVSVTVTKDNLNEVISDEFMRWILNKGAGMLFYIEYVPFDEDTISSELSCDDVKFLMNRADLLMKKYKLPVLVFPGDEDKYGGCLSAGRGFFHVSSSGDIEPCPFSPYSKYNIKDMTIREAINSDFFKGIREISLNSEGSGGCTLFRNKERVKELIDS